MIIISFTLGLVRFFYIPNTVEKEARELQIDCQPDLHSETPLQKSKESLENGPTGSCCKTAQS